MVVGGAKRAMREHARLLAGAFLLANVPGERRMAGSDGCCGLDAPSRGSPKDNASSCGKVPSLVRCVHCSWLVGLIPRMSTYGSIESCARGWQHGEDANGNAGASESDTAI